MEQQMLKDKVAIITGASYGMGQTMAELFAEEGAAVVLTARHQDKLDAVVEGIRGKGGKAVGVVADVCSTEDTKRVFETALKKFG
ncbi:MAG TPA: SDR family NAD(P)-dependent oxidoreductase, partial [Candidatus Limivivens merdigallinarum]|nr:SDR family NAD(P)-dependent oxidoreductase [Candidatus Limivivens merdigallinarum]